MCLDGRTLVPLCALGILGLLPTVPSCQLLQLLRVNGACLIMSKPKLPALTRAGLSVSKATSVEPIEYIFDLWLGNGLWATEKMTDIVSIVR